MDNRWVPYVALVLVMVIPFSIMGFLLLRSFG